MNTEEQIAEYLAKGYKAAQVASFCSVTPQYISELAKSEHFKELLRDKMATFQSERISTRYDDLEEVTLKQLKEEVASASVNDLTRILESISRIKHSNKQPPADSLRNPTLGVTLVFNSNNQPKLITDETNRIIAIGDNTMMPMPAKAVRDMFTKRIEAEDAEEIPTREQLAAISQTDLAA